MLEGWMDGMKGTGDEAMWEDEEEWNGLQRTWEKIILA